MLAPEQALEERETGRRELIDELRAGTAAARATQVRDATLLAATKETIQSLANQLKTLETCAHENLALQRELDGAHDTLLCKERRRAELLDSVDALRAEKQDLSQ